MHSSCRVGVSLSSFGASEVRRHGQGWFVRLCEAAGADGVELRGELLRGGMSEVDELAAIVRGTALDCAYSSPDMLWDAQGELNVSALDSGLAYAQALGASVLKMSIGGFGLDSTRTFSALGSRLAPDGIRLLIENDQTVRAGTLGALRLFFQAADEADLDLGMTFDMGNWHWVGECPMLAAQTFAARVRYVHCKGVQRQPARWVAVPLSDSAAPWRAVLRAMPSDAPRAIEYPLVGDDLLLVVQNALGQLRTLEN